ncbi:hypothetical protein TSAR_003752 [Trichomalopsis sarcophagae]|uniref:Uncharacterized protein n=1 Tax=Trichomalopsis sarcophagae TaxID=543379 RepID=A0A232FJ94_9HYME|nr:hypothetical protein TSAR_003752 [Trichomalopsis sarcophagae]
MRVSRARCTLLVKILFNARVQRNERNILRYAETSYAIKARSDPRGKTANAIKAISYNVLLVKLINPSSSSAQSGSIVQRLRASDPLNSLLHSRHRSNVSNPTRTIGACNVSRRVRRRAVLR